MTQQGRLTEWNDERGFGFVTPLGGGPRAFVHISRFPGDLRRPMLNDLLNYSISHDGRGRPQADDVSFLTPAHAKHEASSSGSLVPVLGVGVFGLVLAAGAILGRVPSPYLGLSAFMSVLLYAMYAADKSAAKAGRWRTSEASLHLVALLGGWPGGLIARHALRHKTIKQPFRFVFWCTVVLNCLVLVAIAWSAAAVPG
jgi:uncharacterized membrane protein YsdA (DUF1294 family)/cold shock CspA family protein